MAPLKSTSTPVRTRGRPTGSNSDATTVAPTPSSAISGRTTRSGMDYGAHRGHPPPSPPVDAQKTSLSPVREMVDLVYKGDDALDRATRPRGHGRPSPPPVDAQTPPLTPIPETEVEDPANEGDDALDRTTRLPPTANRGQSAWGDKFSQDRHRRTAAVLDAAIETKAMLNERGAKEKRWRSVVTSLKEANVQDKNGLHLFAALQPNTIETADGAQKDTASFKTVMKFFDTLYDGWVKHAELQAHTSGNFADMPYFDALGGPMETALVTSMEIIKQNKKDHDEAVATRTTVTPARQQINDFSRKVSVQDLRRTRQAADNIRDADRGEDVDSSEEDGSGEDDEALPSLRPPKKKRREPQRKPNDPTESFQTTRRDVRGEVQGGGSQASDRGKKSPG